MNELDSLFDGSLEEKNIFNENAKSRNDGLYTIDFTKVKDKTKGWRSVVRLLPNLTQEGNVDKFAIEKMSHFVDIKDPKELSGYFDSPKNFGEPCPLSSLYWELKNSKNAILVEKADCLNFSRKYYSYVLVLEDEQQPELVGKIMVFSYGKIIKDKILSEKNGEITGIPCNVFDLAKGKDFVLIGKETVVKTNSGKDITFADIKMSTFKPNVTSISITNSNGELKNVPLNSEGKIENKYHDRIKKFLLDREYEIDTFGPKPLSEEQQERITEISNFLTGKFSSGFSKRPKSTDVNNPTSSDFSFDEPVTASTKSDVGAEEEDDFFSDF